MNDTVKKSAFVATASTNTVKKTAFANVTPAKKTAFSDNDVTNKSAFATEDNSTTITKPMVWKTLPTSPIASSRTDDIWFFDENTGWLVNSSGYVCKTTDGGGCWHPKLYVCPTSKGYPYLRCMGWGSEKVGWIGSVTGIGGTSDAGLGNPDDYIDTLLRHTTDGGETWSNVTNLPNVPGVTPAGICGFYAVNEQVAYGSGTNDPGMPGPAIVKTTNGGKSWQLIDMEEHADNLIDIYFMDENNGFVVGGKNCDDCDINYEAYPPPRLIRYAKLKPVVLRTTDGGATWTNVAADTTGFMCGEWGWKIQFVNDKVGFVSLENFASAGILKTTDGGATWTRHAVKDQCGNIINKDLEGIGFITETQGWVGGWGNDFAGLMNSYTADGGTTWMPQNNNPSIKTPPGNSDDRIRINRYRFVKDATTQKVIAGYCSGQQVYKLQFCGAKKAAFADDDGAAKKAAFAAKTRIEPARSDEPAQKSAFSDNSDNVKPPTHDFAMDCKKQADGNVEISFDVPEGVDKVFVGLWNQLAFYVKTLVNAKVDKTGRQTLIWDGSDDEGKPVGEGVYICRLSADGCQGSSQMVQLGKR